MWLFAWHARGHEFEPRILHQTRNSRMISCGCFLFDSMSFMGGVRTLPSEVFPADPEGQFFRYSTAARPSLRG